jgi:hypothetical protein
MRLFLFCIVFIPFVAQAQTDLFSVRGIVRGETGEGLPGVSIFYNDTSHVRTDESGNFYFQVAYQPESLNVRYLGYFSRRIVLTPSNFVAGSARLEIELSPQQVQLSEVQIGATKEARLYEEDYQHTLLDYTFAGENILALVLAKKRTYLELWDDSGRRLTQLQLGNGAQRLHESCLGGYHAVGPDFCHEISIFEQTIDTFPAYDSRQFWGLLEPCVAYSDDYFYFRQYGLFEKSVIYYYLDPKGHKVPLIQVEDKTGEELMKEAYVKLVYNQPLMMHDPFGPTPSISDFGFGAVETSAVYSELYHPDALLKQVETPDQMAHFTWMELLREDTVYVPILNMNDTLLLFDHVNDQLYRFEAPFKNTRVVPIQYHREKDWARLLLKDEVLGQVYGMFSNSKTTVLKRIDVDNGEVQAVFSLPEVHLIAHHFKVRNGYLYYIGQPDIRVPNQTLFKLRVY